MDLLDSVRTRCEKVAEISRHVQINVNALPSYAAALPLERIANPVVDPDCHYLGHGTDTVSFFMVLDTVNFGSGYFPHMKKRPGMSGYFTVASSLNDYFNTNGPFSARELINLSITDCCRIFDQDIVNEHIRELMHLFASALNDLGQFLTDRFHGSFTAPVEQAGGSAEELVRQLIAMSFFNDVESYGEFRVPFFKRAQLTVADLNLAFAGQGPGNFNDLDRLTMFADNLVPHVLRVDGILRYENNLAQKIDREELIYSGSPEEVEIRACAIHVVELLAAELKRQGSEVTSMQLDYLLWNRGQQPFYKRGKPRHRTRSVFY